MLYLNAYGVWILAVGAVAFTSGCNESRDTGSVTSKSGGETSNAPAAEAVEERDHALIRAVNAIPGQSAVTIYAGDSAAFRDVGYKKATAYEEIPNHMFNFQIKSGDAPKGESLRPIARTCRTAVITRSWRSRPRIRATPTSACSTTT